MRTLRIGLGGGLLAAGIAAATPGLAQESAAAAQPAEKCSFLGCLLRDRQAAPAARGEAVAQAPPADAARAGGPGLAKGAPASAAKEGAPAGEDPAGGRATAHSAAKPAAAKAEPAVTLAADPAEKGRLKALAAARPRHRLRLVAAGSQDAELTLKPVLEASPGALPLYSEQLHVLAGSSIASLDDLRDKQVSFGPADGATAAVARRAFAAAGIAVKETPLDEANALDGLGTGDIAALVILAPQPAAPLARLRAPGLHLLDWPQGAALPEGMRLQLLDAKSYSRLEKGETHAPAVDAVLSLTPKGERSPAARGLFASLKDRTASLARRGFDRLGSAEPALRQGRAVAKERRP